MICSQCKENVDNLYNWGGINDACAICIKDIRLKMYEY